MKKPTPEARKWHAIHSRNLERRRKRSKGSGQRRRGSPHGSRGNGRLQYVHIPCPENFSLDSNFAGVVEVIDEIRSWSKTVLSPGRFRIHIDFRPIRHLEPNAALVLAAELDRWNHLPIPGQLEAIDVHEWDPGVRELLADMGFFDLLHVTEAVPRRRPDEAVPRRRFVKFRTGSKADGEAFDRLRREDLDPVVGEVPRKVYLYGAVTEAMTNVVHHAYKGSDLRPNWWLSAWYEAEERRVAIMIYDHGAGIPETLPRRFRDHVAQFTRRDHAHMIREAHDLDRTATRKRHRGHGLERDVRGYLEKIDCEGYYRVLSLKGEYLCETHPDRGYDHELKEHLRPLNGTLIEWKLQLR